MLALCACLIAWHLSGPGGVGPGPPVQERAASAPTLIMDQSELGEGAGPEMGLDEPAGSESEHPTGTSAPVALVDAPHAESDDVESDPGEVQPVPGDANPSVRAVVEAAQAGSSPERFSAMVLPAPFDRERFLANPEFYLATPEPGRVYQVAQPGPQVPRLRRLSPGSSEIPRGGQVELVVRTEALMPVTFTSFDLGGFDNQLTTITVQADGRGFARATFHAVAGTIAGTDVLAASPVTSGQIHFTITIIDPGSPAQRDGA